MELSSQASATGSSAEQEHLAGLLRLVAAAIPPAPDNRIHVDYPEAAVRLNIPETWLRERIGSLPHRKIGRWVRFSVDDLSSISEMYAVRPSIGHGTTTATLKPSSRSRSRS